MLIARSDGSLETAEPIHEFKDDGEVVVAALYFDVGEGNWQPHSVFTGKETPSGWRCSEFDFEWSKRDSVAYYHCSGGGGRPYIGSLVEAAKMPGRIWLRDGVTLGGDSGDDPVDDPIMLAMGWVRILGPVPNPFEDAVEGRAHWCETCEDMIHDEDSDVGECCSCGVPFHIHVGSLIVVRDGDEAGVDPGVYQIRALPYVVSNYVDQRLIVGNLARVDGAAAVNYDLRAPCGHVCAECFKGDQ